MQFQEQAGFLHRSASKNVIIVTGRRGRKDYNFGGKVGCRDRSAFKCLQNLQGPEKRKEYNIKDNLVRFSCGVEDVEDIWNDLAQALEKALGSQHAPRTSSPKSASKGNGAAIPVPALEPV